jgi:hypothetical protein
MCLLTPPQAQECACVVWVGVVCLVCLLAAMVRVWWMFEWYCFELIPLWGDRRQ